MIGFIKGLFGSKKTENIEVQKPEPAVVRQKPAAFFLDADDAQTYGNLEYMRTAKAVQRTFPKTVSGQEKPMLRSISAIKRAEQLAQQAATAETLPITQIVQPTGSVEPAPTRRRADTSMDMFRKMARDIKKP